MQIIECVPNFSEGLNPFKVQSIVRAMAKISTIQILDVDMGRDANRTVVTLTGSPGQIIDAGFQGIAESVRQIDMRHQKGAHPRIGATDVFPLIPFRDVTMDSCVMLSKQLAERVGRELDLPVYLYEDSASSPFRKSLSSIRSVEFEAFQEKMNREEWRPDFGPCRLHPTAGAVVIGARPLLIAYNINLSTQDLKTAQTIAAEVRESGTVRGTHRVPGHLRACKAIGWIMPGYEKAQISMNLVDYRITPPHLAYETVKTIAVKYGVTVTGSELIGMIPLDAMLMAGQYYALNAGLSLNEASALIDVAVESLGLNDVRRFDASQKVLEYKMSLF